MHAAVAFAPAPARWPAPCGAQAAGHAAVAVRTGIPPGPSLHARAAGLGCGAAAALGWAAAARRGRRRAVARSATQKEWRERCKEVAGGAAVFEVTVSKPLGAKLTPFPPQDPRGVGIGEVIEGAGCWTLNREVLTQGGDGMWVLEGDEVLAVDGVDIGGSVDKIVECVQGSESDTVTLTLSRHYLKLPKGPVKVVFSPSGNMVTVGRGTSLEKAASLANEDIVCELYNEVGTNKSYEMSIDEAPQGWDNIMPMTLVPLPGQTKEKAIDDTLFGGTRAMDSAPGTLPR